MDLNLVVLCGQLTAPPELRAFDSGSRLVRYLLAIRSEQPKRRLDVVPVVQWDPPEELLTTLPEQGARLWVSGSVQRRFWDAQEGRRSRLEIVAEQVCLRDSETDEALAGA